MGSWEFYGTCSTRGRKNVDKLRSGSGPFVTSPCQRTPQCSVTAGSKDVSDRVLTNLWHPTYPPTFPPDPLQPG